MHMHDVTLTIPDLEAATPREAAMAFLSALMSADWVNMTLIVNGMRVNLTGAEVHEALSWMPAEIDPIKPREPYGVADYLESDRDFVENNMGAAVHLLERFGPRS